MSNPIMSNQSDMSEQAGPFSSDDFAGYRLSLQQRAACARWRESGRVPALGLTLQLSGAVTATTLRARLEALALRHEVLRSPLRDVPGLKWPLQWPLETPLVAVIEGASPANLLERAIEALDPVRGPLLTVALAGDGRVALALPATHGDCASLAHITAVLGGAAIGDDDNALQYIDYAEWQNALLDGDFGEQGRAWWESQLDRTSVVALPFRLTRTETGSGLRVSCGVPESAGNAISALARVCGLSEREAALGLWTLYLGRLFQWPRLAVSVLMDMRSEELQGAIGPFEAAVPLVWESDTDTTARLALARLREAFKDALAWQECAPQEPSSCGFEWLDSLPAQDVAVERPGAAILTLQRHASSWRISAPEGEFDAADLQALADQFARFALGAATAPDTRIDAIALGATPSDATAPATTGDTTLLHELFERHAASAPQAVALIAGERRVSYGELLQRSRAIAAGLVALGAGPDRVIGVCSDDAVDMVAMLLGILMAGAAYLPLDPSYPAERLAFMARDAGALRVVVGGAGGRAANWDNAIALETLSAASGPMPKIAPDHLAYVIYTSGSTGTPKGVLVSHRNAVASTRARASFYENQPAGFLLLSPFSFDSSVAGIFWTLAAGGALCLPDEMQRRDPRALATLVTQHALTHLLTLPSFYRQLLDHLPPAVVRCAIVAGEACPPDLIGAHHTVQAGAALVNEYGPTEATVWSTAAVLDTDSAQRAIPIGRAVDSVEVLLLDAQLRPAAVGETGEIYIAGPGLTRGYHARPGVTAERFVANPYRAGARMYRSGDLARQRADGVIECLGRADHQVKIRGFRIEPGEVEAALRALPGLRDVAVIAADDPAGGRRLVAYGVADTDATEYAALIGQWSAFAERVLPAHMRPARFVALARLPLTPNGKLDRAALPDPDAVLLRPEFVAPHNETQRALAAIWQELLKVPRVGLGDHFIRLGGHSLLATQVVAQIQARLRVDLPLRALFESESLEALAEAVAGLRESSAVESAALDDLLAEFEEGATS